MLNDGWANCSKKPKRVRAAEIESQITQRSLRRVIFSWPKRCLAPPAEPAKTAVNHVPPRAAGREPLNNRHFSEGDHAYSVWSSPR
jgi:hypothetical protein